MERKNVELILCLAVIPALLYWIVSRWLHLGQDGREALAAVVSMLGVFLAVKRHG